MKPSLTHRYTAWFVTPSLVVVAAAILAGSIAIQPAAAADRLTPLSDEQSRALNAVEPDPPPAELAGGAHFPVSNEIRCHLWSEISRDRGGAYIGVGTDQNYLLAGWAKPELLILMDFDQLVPDLHKAFAVAFTTAPDPARFMEMWSAQNAASFQALLEKQYTDPATRKRVVDAFVKWRKKIEYRLKFVQRQHKNRKIPTFLDDADQYNYIAGLFKAGRVLAVRGDLTGSKAMRQIGQVAKDMGMPVRVLYLSNAEAYFKYVDDFRKNILNLPFDERSIVLRTVGHGSWKNGDPFIYIDQDARNFVEWVKSPRIGSVAAISPWRVAGKNEYQFSITRLPPTGAKH